jgi:hypothetical protein
MKSLNQSIKEQHYRAIGSGKEYFPLPQTLLNLVFNNSIKNNLLGSYINVVWNEKYGFTLEDKNGIIKLLVISEEGLNITKDLYTSLESARQLSASDYKKQLDKTVKTLSEFVYIGRIKDYNASDIDEFIDNHFTTSSGDAICSLIDEKTQATGSNTLWLSSYKKSINKPLTANSPIKERQSVVKSQENIQSTDNRFKASLMLREKLLSSNNKKEEPYVVSPFELDKTRLIDQNIYVTNDGKLTLVPEAESKTLKDFVVGNGIRYDAAYQIVNGTNAQQFYREGLMVNPLNIFPSSFFTPVANVIPNIFGPLSFVENKEMILGILAVALLSDKNSQDKYTHKYNNIPTQIIDNKDIEKELFENGNI